MKTIFFVFVMSMLSLTDFAQENNPYNQRGLDYVSSLAIISSDVNAGKVKEFSDESVKYYSGIIPLKCNASGEMAATILKTLKSPEFNLTTLVDNSRLSEAGQQACMDIFYARDMTTEAYKARLVERVDQINRASIREDEKEMVLSMLAIAYNVTSDAQSSMAHHCDAFALGMSTPVSCAAAGAVAGGLVGWAICGAVCALGGAVVGGVIGALC